MLTKLMILIMCASLGLNPQPRPQTYPMTAVVVATDTTTDTVSIMDFNGNIWEFYGVYDWMVGDICSALMNDQGTPCIYDDTVELARYCGWVNGSWGYDYKTNKELMTFLWE